MGHLGPGKAEVDHRRYPAKRMIKAHPLLEIDSVTK
jgi:hypothetical protein